MWVIDGFNVKGGEGICIWVGCVFVGWIKALRRLIIGFLIGKFLRFI